MAEPETELGEREFADIFLDFVKRGYAEQRDDFGFESIRLEDLIEGEVMDEKTCQKCKGSGLMPERAMGDPQGQLPCDACAGTGKAR